MTQALKFILSYFHSYLTERRNYKAKTVFLVPIIVSISLTLGWKEKSEVRGFKQLVYSLEENLDLLYKHHYGDGISPNFVQNFSL